MSAPSAPARGSISDEHPRRSTEQRITPLPQPVRTVENALLVLIGTPPAIGSAPSRPPRLGANGQAS
jgi:hypothetical protein